MKKFFKAIIIDDEKLARNELKRLLSPYKNIEVINQAEDVPSAVKIIEFQKPDIIFLDVQMPRYSGFDLFEQTSINAQVIFVTAYDSFAIRAFEVNALDYLLKPINPDRLAQTIAKLENGVNHQTNESRKLKYDDRIFLPIDKRIRFLKVKAIKCIQSAGDYSEIITINGQKELILKSMKEWEQRLPNQYFIRIHRSTIINMDYIERLDEWHHYSYLIYLKGLPAPFIMSRRYAAKLKHLLS